MSGELSSFRCQCNIVIWKDVFDIAHPMDKVCRQMDDFLVMSSQLDGLLKSLMKRMRVQSQQDIIGYATSPLI
jgi:hypothetical protein